MIEIANVQLLYIGMYNEKLITVLVTPFSCDNRFCSRNEYIHLMY